MSFADTISASGFNGKLMFDVMPWFGDGQVHRVSRYQSIDTQTIHNQLTLIQAAGGKGVRVTWEGPAFPYTHQATIEICQQCGSLGLLFSLMLDPHVNGQAGWNTDPGFLAMTASDRYIPEKYLCDFSTGIDYTKATLPSGFSVLANQQGFGWANAYGSFPPGQTAATLNALTLAELQSINKNPAMKWPFVTLGFCDAGTPTPSGVKPAQFTGTRAYGTSVWTASKQTRAIDHEGGNFFFDCATSLLLCPSAPYVGMVWNDHDEGAGVEHFMSAFAGLRLGK